MIVDRISKSDYCYGISTYKRVKRNLELLNREPHIYDVRNFHILWEHKRIMTQRLKYWNENNIMRNIDNAIQNSIYIEKQATIIKNMMLKWAMKREQYLMDRAGQILNELIMTENKLYTELVFLLKKNR